MGEFLKNHIWPLLVSTVASLFLNYKVIDPIQKQVANLDMPSLWIDYFYDESAREAALSIKNVDARNRSFKDLKLQLKFDDVVSIDSLVACYNTLTTAISTDSIKTSNQKDYLLSIKESLHVKDFVVIKAKLRGSVYHAEMLNHPEICVRGEGVSVGYFDQEQILKNYSLIFKVGEGIVTGLLFCIGALGSFVSFYKTKSEGWKGASAARAIGEAAEKQAKEEMKER